MAREHIRAFQAIPGVTVRGIWNRTRTKAEMLAAEFNIAEVATDIVDLQQRTAADLVVVAVAEMSINSVLQQVAQQPWTILMEKPVGVDYADGLQVQFYIETFGRKAFVGLNRRFLASTQAVITDLANDSGLRFIHVQDQQSLNVARDIGHPDAVVQNWMYANSVHLVDYLTLLGRGEIVGVEPVTRWDAAAPGVVLAKIVFSSGDLGLYEAIWNGPGPWACTVTTPRRRWEMRPLEKAVFQNVGERALNSAPTSAFDADFKPGFRLQAEGVVDALRGAPSSVPDIREAMRSMRLVRDIYMPEIQ